MSELLPCPFCGGAARLVDTRTQCYVWCTECLSRGPDLVKTQEAIDAWNRRVSATTSQSVVAGALYDLMGYLTTLDTPIRLGATELATPAVDALVAFARERGLSLDDPDISAWNRRVSEKVESENGN